MIRFLDTSRWNHFTPGGKEGPIDFEAVRLAGFDGWAGRCSVGDYYTDPWYLRDYAAAKAAGLITMAYHVPVSDLDDAGQVHRFQDSLADTRPDAIVEDMEWKARPFSAQRATECLGYHAGEALKLSWKPRVLLYTNQAFCDKFIRATFGLDLFIASPGKGNGYNTGSRPSMPVLYKDLGYKVWQRDWKAQVPGVPKLHNDLSEWHDENATLQEVQDYFGISGEEQDMDYQQIMDQLAIIRQGVETNSAKLDRLLAQPGSDVLPATLITIQRAPRANAFSYEATDKAGKPIMHIYPGDNSETEDRIQFVFGTRLAAEPVKVTATGGGKFWQLQKEKGRRGETLYIKEDDAL